MSVYDFIPFQTGSFDHSDIMYFCDCSWTPTQIRSFQCWNHYHSSDMKKCLKLFDHIQLPKGMAFKVGNMTEVQWEIHEHVIIIDASYMDWLKNINRTALCSHMCMSSNSYLMGMVSHQSLVQYQTLMNFSWRNIVVNKPLQQCLFYFIIFFKSHSLIHMNMFRDANTQMLKEFRIDNIFENIWNFHRNQCFVALGRSYFEWWLSVGLLLSKKSAVFDLATLLALQRDFSLCPA